MKRHVILLFGLLTIFFHGYCQQDMRVKRLTVDESIQIGKPGLYGRFLDTLLNDTSNLANKSRSIMTAKAVYDFVRGRTIDKTPILRFLDSIAAVKLLIGPGGGLSGGNLGAGFRLYAPGSQGMKTVSSDGSVLIDSATANQINFKVDSAKYATAYANSLKINTQRAIDSLNNHWAAIIARMKTSDTAAMLQNYTRLQVLADSMNNAWNRFLYFVGLPINKMLIGPGLDLLTASTGQDSLVVNKDVWVRVADTANIWMNKIKKSNDSVYYNIGGTWHFAFLDNGGTGSGTVNSGTQYRIGIYSTTGPAISENAAITASRALVSDPNGVPTHSATTSTEIGYVNGVTSAIQTQLNGKASSTHNHAASDINSGTLPIARGGTNSGTTLNNNRVMVSSGSAIVEASAITPSRVLVSDANGIPVAATPTTTEINYLSGLSSNAQTQISGKQASNSHLTAISGLTPTNDDILQYKAGAWANRTPTQVTADLNTFTSSLKGLAPASGGGTTNFLRADGTWAAPAGGGGSTDHTALSNLAWTSSGHTGTANRFAAFNGSGVAVYAAAGTDYEVPITFSSKYLSRSSNTVSYRSTPTALTDAATTNWDLNTDGTKSTHTAGGNRTLSISNMANGDYVTYVLTQDGVGGRVTTLPGGSTTLSGQSAGTSQTYIGLYVGSAWQWRYGATLTGYLLASNNLSDVGSAATVRTNLGLTIGTNVQAYSANLTTYAGIPPSSNVQSLLGAADYAAMRTQLGLVIGTNVQAYDADLTTYAGITPSANIQSFLGSANYATARTNMGATTLGSNIFTLTNPSALGYIRANADNTVSHRTYANVRTDLGLVIGTDVQAYNANLTTYAGIAPSANIQSFLGSANYSTARTNLGLAIGTDVQAYSASLTNFASKSTTGKFYYLSAAGTWSAVNVSTGLSFNTSTGDLTASGSSDNDYYSTYTPTVDDGDISFTTTVEQPFIYTITDGELVEVTGQIKITHSGGTTDAIPTITITLPSGFTTDFTVERELTGNGSAILFGIDLFPSFVQAETSSDVAQVFSKGTMTGSQICYINVHFIYKKPLS